MLEGANLDPLPLSQFQTQSYGWLKDFSRNTAAQEVTSGGSAAAENGEAESDADDRDLNGLMISVLKRYAEKHARALGLAPGEDRRITVRGFHPSIRIAKDGQLLVELVAQFTQLAADIPEDGGVSNLAGVTIVASADGRIRYIARKSLPHPTLDEYMNRAARERLDRQRAFVADCDARDAMLAVGDPSYEARRIALRTNFAPKIR